MTKPNAAPDPRKVLGVLAFSVIAVQLVAGDVTVHVVVLSSTAVTVYDVGEPVPAVTVTTACELPATALGVPGVPGGGPAAGVTEPDALEYEPVPIALIAAILK